ncbi:hypothetical protein D9M68_570670 [compost metagenome]
MDLVVAGGTAAGLGGGGGGRCRGLCRGGGLLGGLRLARFGGRGSGAAGGGSGVLLVGGLHGQARFGGLVVRRGDEGQADHAQRAGRQGPGELVAVVAGVEVVAHQYRDHRDPGQDQPVVLAAVGAREVVADHDEQHRQGEVVVVARTQQALGRQYRVRGAVLFDGLNQGTLGRHDDAEHVADHDGADQRADVDVGATAAEHLGEGPGRADDQDEEHQAEQGGGLAQRRIAEEVVDEPAGDQRTDADGDGGGRGNVHAGCDQVQGRVQVEHHGQQGDARQPGEIGFPFEPVQVVRHFRRGELVFLQVVDAATVDGPEITRQPVARVGAIEVVLQPDEIEGCADPGDAGDHVNPANAQVQPFGQMCFHSCYLFPADRHADHWASLISGGGRGAVARPQ